MRHTGGTQQYGDTACHVRADEECNAEIARISTLCYKRLFTYGGAPDCSEASRCRAITLSRIRVRGKRCGPLGWWRTGLMPVFNRLTWGNRRPEIHRTGWCVSPIGMQHPAHVRLGVRSIINGQQTWRFYARRIEHRSPPMFRQVSGLVVRGGDLLGIDECPIVCRRAGGKLVPDCRALRTVEMSRRRDDGHKACEEARVRRVDSVLPASNTAPKTEFGPHQHADRWPSLREVPTTARLHRLCGAGEARSGFKWLTHHAGPGRGASSAVH